MNQKTEIKPDLSDLNIYQRINLVMQSVKYVQKDAEIKGSGQSYKGVSHDNLISESRQAFIDAGIVIYPEQTSSEFLQLRDLNNNIKQHFYDASYVIHFVNIDKPGDRISVPINAHGLDSGDKASGKAITYATKSAVLKVLFLETGINDESREETAERIEQEKLITDQQINIIKNLLDNDQDKISKVCQYYKINSLTNIPKENFDLVITQLKRQLGK